MRACVLAKRLIGVREEAPEIIAKHQDPEELPEADGVREVLPWLYFIFTADIICHKRNAELRDGWCLQMTELRLFISVFNQVYILSIILRSLHFGHVFIIVIRLFWILKVCRESLVRIKFYFDILLVLSWFPRNKKKANKSQTNPHIDECLDHVRHSVCHRRSIECDILILRIFNICS